MTENEEKTVAEKEKKEPSFFKVLEDFKKEVREDMEKYNKSMSDKFDSIFEAKKSADSAEKEIKKEIKPVKVKEKIETQKKKKKVLFGKLLNANKKAGD